MRFLNLISSGEKAFWKQLKIEMNTMERLRCFEDSWRFFDSSCNQPKILWICLAFDWDPSGFFRDAFSAFEDAAISKDSCYEAPGKWLQPPFSRILWDSLEFLRTAAAFWDLCEWTRTAGVNNGHNSGHSRPNISSNKSKGDAIKSTD